jgi:hypothetical protein
MHAHRAVRGNRPVQEPEPGPAPVPFGQAPEDASFLPELQDAEFDILVVWLTRNRLEHQLLSAHSVTAFMPGRRLPLSTHYLARPLF